MRICLFLPDDYSGGIFPVASSVCRLARQAGHDACVLMLCTPAGNHREAGDAFVHSLNLPSKSPQAPEHILSWLESHQIEMLVLNGCEEADPIIPYLPEHISCVYAIHDTARWYWIQAVRFQRELDAIVAVSDVVARKVRPRLEDQGKLAVIPNGSSFPAPPGPNETRPDDLLFVGGDDAMKGMADVLRVWKALQRRGFKGGLHWCGHTEPGFKRILERLPGRERVVLHGRISRARVFELARRSKVVLAPTRAESFGMVTLEAMSMGCVPVAWDIETGTKTLVEVNVHGLFVPLGDYECFAATVLDAIDRHAELGQAASRRARCEFSEEAMWGRYESVVRQCRPNGKVRRPRAGEKPPQFQARLRLSGLLPKWVWKQARTLVTHNPRLAYKLRDFRRI